MSCGIYKITNEINGKCYIGSSKHIEKRWKEHIRELNKNKHANIFLQSDWNKYGKNLFKFEILEITGEEERYEIEQSYLDSVKPFYHTNNGYNINEYSTMKNPSNLRIFKNKFYKLNPFYKSTKSKIKQMLKQDEYMDYEIDKIDTQNKYEWYDIEGAYCVAKPHNSKARIIDEDYINTHTREEILDYCYALDTYDEIAKMMVEYGGDCIDDWY